MDQLKRIINTAIKHLFWVLGGVIVLLSMGSWFMARSSLENQFKANLASIDQKYGTLQELRKKPYHPNDSSHKGMDALNANLLQSVFNAWEAQFARQTELKWDRRLGDDFIAAVGPLIPIELKVAFPTPIAEEIKVDFRQRYANYVERLLPVLAERVGSKWAAKAGSSMGGGMGEAASMPMESGAPNMGAMMGPDGMRKEPPEKPQIVLWSATDQSRLLTDHFDWSRMPDSAPNTLQLLYAQEDLWVLTALMNIIRDTNGEEIESRHDAVVKSIESILIGRQAAGLAGQVLRFGSGGEMAGPYSSGSGAPTTGPTTGGPTTGAPTTGAPTTGGPMGAYPMSTPGMTSGSGGDGAGARAAMDPADYRYEGMDRLPMPASKLRSSMKSDNSEDSYYVVAKRMPIRMRLLVDQRKLHRLLTACGNSRLPVEIRQVRINRKGTEGSGMAAGMSSSGGMGSSGAMSGSGYGGGYSPMGGSGGGYTPGGGMSGGGEMSGYGGSPTPPTTSGEMGSGYMAGMQPFGAPKGRGDYAASVTDYDVPVELQGIIYIYNPVDKNRLGMQDAAAAATPPAATPPAATPPAATPPAATPPAATPPAATPPAAAPPAAAPPAAPPASKPAAATTPTAPAAAGPAATPPAAPATPTPPATAPAAAPPAAAKK